MAETNEKKTSTKAGVRYPSRPKDAKSTESQYSYYTRKYMEARSARSVPEAATIELDSDV